MSSGHFRFAVTEVGVEMNRIENNILVRVIENRAGAGPIVRPAGPGPKPKHAGARPVLLPLFSNDANAGVFPEARERPAGRGRITRRNPAPGDQIKKAV